MYVPISPDVSKYNHWSEHATREQLYGMTTSLPTLQLPKRQALPTSKGRLFLWRPSGSALIFKENEVPRYDMQEILESTGSSLRPWCRIGIIVQSFSTPNGDDDDDDDDPPVSIFYVFTVCRFLQRKVVISFAKRMSSCCQLQILADKLNQSSGKYFNIKAFFPDGIAPMGIPH